MPTNAQAPTVLILEGLFYALEDEFRVQTAEGDLPLAPQLAPFEGRFVEASLHHYPPTPPQPRAPGFGCCRWGEHCPCGHQTNPTWLYSLQVKGVLGPSPKGIWSVGATRLPLRKYMLGHRVRIVLFAGGAKPDPDASVDDLLAEAEGLLGVLGGLKDVVRKERK